MIIKFKKTSATEFGIFYPNDVADIQNSMAKQLVEKGFAEKVETEKPEKRQTKRSRKKQ